MYSSKSSDGFLLRSASGKHANVTPAIARKNITNFNMLYSNIAEQLIIKKT